jgi:antitoxin HicB
MTSKEMVIGREFRYTVVFHPTDDGGYVVTCPALPGLVTEGDTLAEARRMASDAIRCYLGSLKKDGIDFPVEELRPHAEQVEVAIDFV